jgi:hypothetical protein
VHIQRKEGDTKKQYENGFLHGRWRIDAPRLRRVVARILAAD